MKRVGRNDACPCGSGRKYKHCCLRPVTDGGRERSAAVSIAAEIRTAIAHHQAGRLSEAQTVYRRVLEAEPNNPDALHLQGLIAHQSARHEAAVELIGKAIATNPLNAAYHSNLGSAYAALKRFEEAIACYRKALSIEPRHAESHNNLGVMLRSQNKIDEAAACYHKALALRPNYAEAHHNLGNLYRDQREPQKAIACYHKALSLRPRYAEAYNGLGNVLRDQRRLDEAVTCYRKSLAVAPRYAEAHNSLGNVLRDQGKLEEAAACYNAALSHNPGYDEVYSNLASVLRRQGKLDEAMACCRKALDIRPEHAEAYNNMGNIWRDRGNRDEAMACYRKALSLKPDLVSVHQALIYTMVQSAEDDGAAVFAECRKFAERFEKGIVQLAHRNDLSPGRRLRVGYVSGDFRQHSVAYFIEPVLANHDHRAVEVFCYSNHRRVDHVTERLMGYADQWRSIVDLSDDGAAARIQEDRIDILVDLSGHTNHNRLLVFARKPAPVQVTWIGLPSTTGLSAMDYRLTNEYTDPPGEADQYHTETLVRLSTPIGYRPEADLPAVNALPALGNGHVTFCSFNNPQKISPGVIGVWSRILARLPGSRLLMVCQESFRRQFREQFLAGGIGAERLEFVDRLPVREYLALHNRADIALDTFPYNGGTTTRNSLWMGVPVVTLAGKVAVARSGMGKLSVVGLEDFVAHTEEDYVGIALRWARDVEGLARVRRELRARMEAAPFSNTQEVEAAYRQMWRTWCSRAPE